jgi:hypothetical protein
LTADDFWINHRFTGHAAVIDRGLRLIARRAGNGTPRGSVAVKVVAFEIITLTVVTFTIVAFAVITAAVSLIAGGATATVCTRWPWTPATFSGTRIFGAFIRVIITADIHHFDLAAFVFQFVVHAFLHQRCAKRADYPMYPRIAITSYKSL